LKKSLEPRRRDCVSIGEQTYRPFLFGALNVTGKYFVTFLQRFEAYYLTLDDDALLVNEVSYLGLGEIKIVIKRITLLRRSVARRGVQDRGSGSGFQVSEINDIHERSKKAVTHKISLVIFFFSTRSELSFIYRFGKEIVRQRVHHQNHSRKHEMVATFIFNYRSLGEPNLFTLYLNDGIIIQIFSRPMVLFHMNPHLIEHYHLLNWKSLQKFQAADPKSRKSPKMKK